MLADGSFNHVVVAIFDRDSPVVVVHGKNTGIVVLADREHAGRKTRVRTVWLGYRSSKRKVFEAGVWISLAGKHVDVPIVLCGTKRKVCRQVHFRMDRRI